MSVNDMKISTDADLDLAIEEIDGLLDKGGARTDADERRLEQLSDAVWEYEESQPW